jgi:hypothetical protein
MEICFYNLNHIGDIYFASLFINLICKQNPDINFLYYFINGDIFFKHIKNLKRISSLEQKYNSTVVNGCPPEDQLDKNILSLFLQNNMEKVGMKIINVNEQNILCVNTWCASEYLLIDNNIYDFEISHAIHTYKKLINIINYDYNMNLTLNINSNDIIDNVYKYDSIDNYENLSQTIFIFNYRPRSEPFSLHSLNKIIDDISKDNNVILSCYDSIFHENSNIKFVDKDYNISFEPSCENLLKLWEIASKCKKIIMLPTGSSWTFLHKLDVLKEDQLFIVHSHYQKKLNDNILFLNEKENFIKLFDMI